MSLIRRRLLDDTIKKTASGNPIVVQSVARMRPGIKIFGRSTQDGTPSPDHPVPIVSAGDSGEIEAKVYGGNLISSDVSSWNHNGWEGTVLQLSDGIKIKAINGWIKVYYDTSEMNGKTLNLSFDYRQIESETTSPMVTRAFSVVVQDKNTYPSEGRGDIFLFQTNSPKTVKTHVSVSFIARNYLCFFLRVNTEGEEAGETRAIEVTNIMLNAGNTELTYEPYKTPQSIVLSTPNGLPGIPVTSGGNYTDADGQQWVCDEIDLARGVYIQRVQAIDSYAGESVSGEYLSTTGELSEGAKVLCILPAPTETPLTTDQTQVYKALHTYSPTTTMMNNEKAGMKLTYKTRKGLEADA